MESLFCLVRVAHMPATWDGRALLGRLKMLLRDRLLDSGWFDSLKQHCRGAGPRLR
jgi:hypothetical protein